MWSMFTPSSIMSEPSGSELLQIDEDLPRAQRHAVEVMRKDRARQVFCLLSAGSRGQAPFGEVAQHAAGNAVPGGGVAHHEALARAPRVRAPRIDRLARRVTLEIRRVADLAQQRPFEA